MQWEFVAAARWTKAFLILVGFAWAENTNFFRKQKLFFAKWPCMIRKKPCSSIKNVAILEIFSNCTWRSLIFSNQKLFLCISLSLLPTKVNYFCKPKHRKFPPSHNLLSTKERRCSFYLRSKFLRCNTGTSHRFKAFSPPFCAKSRFRLVPSETSPKAFPAELWIVPGVQRFANLWGTFGSFRTSEKNKIVPLQEARGSANLESAHKTTTSHKPN